MELLEHVRHLAMDDAPGQPLGDRGLANAGIADEQRVVLLASAQHLNGAVDLLLPPDQRVDLAFARLLVEVDAVIVQRVALLLRLLAGFLLGFLVDAARRALLGKARALGDAMTDVVDRIVARHLLLLQEIGGVAFALGEDRDQHIGAGDLLAARGLDVDHGALDHPLEASGRLGILATVGDEVFKLGFHVGDEIAAQLVEIDVAGAHHRGGVLIVDQSQQQVLERGIFVVALVCERQRTMERLLEAARKGGHLASLHG